MSTDPFEPLMTFKPRMAGKRSEVDPHRVPLLRVALKRHLQASAKQKQPAGASRSSIAVVAEPKAVHEQTKRVLAEPVRQSAVKAAKNAAGAAITKRVSIGVGVIVGALPLVGWGEAAGWQGGRREPRDEGVRRSGGRVIVGEHARWAAGVSAGEGGQPQRRRQMFGPGNGSAGQVLHGAVRAGEAAGPMARAAIRSKK